MEYTLDFEKPVSDLEAQLKELKEASLKSKNVDFSEEIKSLQLKVDELLVNIYKNLTPWERTLLSRHPMRPHTVDYINHIISDFHEIHGDRSFFDDHAMMTGFGYLGDQKVAVIGIEKGRKTQEKIKRNFGMPNPEGYKKAMRLMELASDYNIPVITFVDTPGAYPGIGAEERGQAHAIAQNLEKMFGLNSPIISVIIGEGGSGGALGIAIADSVLMMEYAIYSVISPESCASILWSDPKMAEKAANSLQLSPGKALELKVIDHIVTEPAGGSHRQPIQAIESTKKIIEKELKRLKKMNIEQLKSSRFEKFRKMGNETITFFSKES